MPLYLIERNFAEQLNVNQEAATAVCQVNTDVGIQWLTSFLSADKKKTTAARRRRRSPRSAAA